MVDEYLLPIEGIETDRLLKDWRWLIGPQAYLVRAIAAVGNLFVEDQGGRIFLLEIEDGTFNPIATSAEHFAEQLASRHNRKAWLWTFLVRELRRSGLSLGPGQCYGYVTPQILQDRPDEGSLEELIEPTDLATHVSLLGQVHRQVKMLPRGATIDEIRVEPRPEP